MTADDANHLRPESRGPSGSLTAEDIADSQAIFGATYSRDATSTGIVVADGFGVRLSVNRGALVIHDGVGPYRRERRYQRATHALSRVVIIGTGSGSLSLEALAWCRRLGIAVLILDHKGASVLASTPRVTDDARLRRAQALAVDQPVGLDIARALLRRKLAAQAALLQVRFGDDSAADTIGDLGRAIADAGNIDEARQLEASAAALYWQSWTGRTECVPRFTSKDRTRVPPHWSRYEGRRSVLASVSSNRKAERPTNGLLNYAYALLEAEAVLACQAVGLDAGMGVVHNDTRSRQSMALDVMEPVRPQVDAFVLDILAARTFRKAEFTEDGEGHCRLRAPLTHDLAESLAQWSRAVAPIAESVAHMIGRAMVGKYQPATPLTRTRSRSAQAVVKARSMATKARSKAEVRARQHPADPMFPTLWSCPECGGQVTDPRHVRCDSCIEADPRQTPEIRATRGRAISARKRALREWEQAHPGVVYEPELWRRNILPRLQGVRLAAIAEAAGISKGYASNIRAGKFTPHVSTWPALAKLAGIKIQQRTADERI